MAPHPPFLPLAGGVRAQVPACYLTPAHPHSNLAPSPSLSSPSPWQLVSGCRYLRDCLGLRLPELRARAAQRVEQQAARRARTQQLLLERFWAMPQELAALRQEAEHLLSQLVRGGLGGGCLAGWAAGWVLGRLGCRLGAWQACG